MTDLFTSENLIALLTLTALEIVLGIDNVIFIAILSNKLPESQRARARSLGISLAVGTRILLLLAITWVMQLTTPLFSLLGKGISGRDLILIGGGLFLIGKSTFEIHEKIDSAEHDGRSAPAVASFAGGFGDYRSWDIGAFVGHGAGGSHCRGRHAVLLRGDCRFCGASPDHEDLGAFLPYPDRHDAGHRRLER